MPIQWYGCNVLDYIPPRLEYCTMWIFHYMKMRDKTTKETIPMAPQLSQQEVEEFFMVNKQVWDASEQRAQLRSIISTKSRCRVNKIVAFACGRMAFKDREPWAVRSAYQHALIPTVREILMEQEGHLNASHKIHVTLRLIERSSSGLESRSSMIHRVF